MRFVICILACVVCFSPASAIEKGGQGDATLILVGGKVWTGEEAAPWADSIAVAGDRILAVGDRSRIQDLAGSETETIELEGQFVSAGFIDNHTHFNRAAALLLGVNLLDVADGEGLKMRVEAARDRLPKGAWILGGDWGAYEEWERGSTGQEESESERRVFSPDRKWIDQSTPDTPVLLWRWDRSAYLANAKSLAAVAADCSWDGVECLDGEMTGRLSPSAGERIRSGIPAKGLDQRLAEARAGMQRLLEHGVTSIHDITPAEQLVVFQELAARGELTVRIYARPTLDRWEELAALGIRHGFGDEWIKIGGLKGFVDGIMGNSSARFYEPYLTSGERGSWRAMMEPPGNMEELLLGADRAGHWPQVHAIGDEAIDRLLEMYQEMIETNGPADRRLRIIHTQVLAGKETAARMARLGIIAEVQPYHAIDDMRWMERRIGERARWAYAFRTLQDAGVRLSFGSDWPGTNASWYPASPVLGMYAAVTRQTLEGEPAGGWFPEERIDVESALRAYTVNNAWAAGEEDLKGTISVGKLADLVVLSGNPLTVIPSGLKDLRVELTVLGGKIAHRSP